MPTYTGTWTAKVEQDFEIDADDEEQFKELLAEEMSPARVIRRGVYGGELLVAGKIKEGALGIGEFYTGEWFSVSRVGGEWAIWYFNADGSDTKRILLNTEGMQELRQFFVEDFDNEIESQEGES